MTDREALQDIIESGINLGAGDFVSMEALKVAASALKDRIESEANDPLTLEQLREMDGEPVYLVDLTERPPDIGGWIIFVSHNDGGFIPRGYGWFTAAGYGKTWLAYSRKPEVTPCQS